jgi:DNA replication and repair protein RecF
MRVARIEARTFRNLTSLEVDLPPRGAVFLGQNGQGKTNLLELLYYPVLFRSVRGARDIDLVQEGAEGFHLRLAIAEGEGVDRTIETGFAVAGRRKRVAVDGAEPERVAEALGSWLAVAFLPSDVGLIAGSAAERRQFLDRTLALADPQYLRALRQFRGAVEQRNAALRRGQGEAAWAFDPAVAQAGAVLVSKRLAWIETYGPEWSAACETLGEPMPVRLEYRGHPELAQREAWPAALTERRNRDLATGTTSVGPHRDDLSLWLGSGLLRINGSTGQQRTAAVALKLCERATLERATGREPAILLDDVFAELDRGRQERLATRLDLGRTGSGGGSGPQVFVTAPRLDELPPNLNLPLFRVVAGRLERT